MGFLDFSGFSSGVIFMGFFSTIWTMLTNLYAHNRKAIFGTAVSKIYNVLNEYIECANKLRNKVNTLDVEKINYAHKEYLHNEVTLPVLELTNKTVMLQMFFHEDERKCIDKILDTAQDFKAQIHIILESKRTDLELSNKYERARTKFNKEFGSSMNKIIDMIHSQLLGKWQESTLSNNRNVSNKCRSLWNHICFWKHKKINNH